MAIIRSSQIEEAIESLKQLTDKYCPLEMLGLIQQMFKAIDAAKREQLAEDAPPLNSDDIIPIVIFMVIRANVQHLGAEISLLEDLMGRDFDQIIRGYVGYCFTTLEVSGVTIVTIVMELNILIRVLVSLQASYQYILSDKFYG